jgi:hypothetical protein
VAVGAKNTPSTAVAPIEVLRADSVFQLSERKRLMSAIPTRRVAATLIKNDSTESRIVVKFLDVRKVIWIPSELAGASSLKRFIIRPVGKHGLSFSGRDCVSLHEDFTYVLPASHRRPMEILIINL